jgi:hypothetical protein
VLLRYDRAVLAGAALQQRLHTARPSTSYDCVQASDRRCDERSVWLYGLSDRSWAAVLFHDGQPVSTVYQGGPRKLWDEVEAAYRWWEAEGRPGIDRFGLTVSQQGQRIWLDTPEQPVGD